MDLREEFGSQGRDLEMLQTESADSLPSPISPYSGKLVNLVVGENERQELFYKAAALPSLQLTPHSVCDLELLPCGAFSPLDRFMGEADYKRVLDEA